MRLLIVTSQFPIAGEPNRGRPIYQTVRELSRLAQVRVLSPVATYPRWAQPRSYLYRASDEHHSVPGCDVEYVRYPALPAVSRPFNGRLCARAIAAPLRAFAPDLVLSYWLYPDAYGAMLAARQAEVPLVVGARGSDLRVRDAISRRLTRPVLHAARRLLVVSEDLGRVAERDYGAHPDRIRAIPNGCDASIFHPADRAEARRALDLPADAEVVTYVGRLVPEKGLRELLAAAGALRASRPRLQLVLVGEGPMHAELAALAAAGELPVRFAGTRPPGEVARWMCASDLVTLPSYSEGHPNVLVEALACGRPVVATPVGGIPEVVDAASGVLVPARDPAALAEGLREALERDWDEAALARRFSRDWRQVAQDTLLACEEVLAEARGERALYAAGST
ncbi:glycosyltransferase [Pseudoxanthomonas sp. 22568]|uniref:glycosyltransferase n=1 Tax=Pseudoxanthomonas sp. 22568 TaxID=3453945 RepID=UPI00296EAA88|nr:glycosyltransferase [Pseudoxanthomonas japonensis]